MDKELEFEKLKELLEIINKYTPRIFEAMNYVEAQERLFPNAGFIEIRDVLSHTYDISKNPGNEDNFNKNLIEIKEHFRRGIVESFQELYEYEASYIYQQYGKYKARYRQFEKILFLDRKNVEKHKRISSLMEEAQRLWVEARNLKQNDIENGSFNDALDKFKAAHKLVLSVEDDAAALLNDFQQRTTILAILLITIIIAVTKLFIR